MELLLSLFTNLGSNVYLLLMYSALACGIYYILPMKLRNGWLLIGSLFFYACCSLRFLALVLLETILGFVVGVHVNAEPGKESSVREKWLTAGVVCCIGILFFFKYYNFFIDRFQLSLASLMIPLGISYYTFRIVSYMADIYMGKRAPEPDFVIYAVYVLFFPQLLSGPIARSEHMTQTMHEGILFRADNLEAGIRLIISGLFKKVVIADRLSSYVTTIFASPSSYPSLALWMAAVLYSIQLYCDFAGYSEIAIGITKCFGFDCPANFLRPYLSKDMREFWKRWHISLSSWLQDYVYIPCGGNRMDKKWKVKRNLLITSVACGLWHGSELKYLVWGVYHGIWNILTPRKKKGQAEIEQRRDFADSIQTLFARIVTFLIAMFGWILFQADSFHTAAVFVIGMFRGFAINITTIEAAVMPFTNDNSCVAYAGTAFILILVLLILELRDEKKSRGPMDYSNLLTAFLFALVLLFSASGTGSFLYANY